MATDPSPPSSGGDTWHLEINGPQGAGDAHHGASASHSILDRGDGTYVLSLTCRVAGEHVAHVGLWSSPSPPAEEAAVSGRLDPGTLPYQLQPVTPVARAAPAASAQPQLHWLPHAPLRLLATPQALTAACTIVWPRPPPPVQAGEPLELLLRATDPWGNPVGSLGGATAVLERLADLDLQPLTLLQPRRAVAGTAAEDDADDLANRYIPCELHRGGFVRDGARDGVRDGARDGARDDDTYFDPDSSTVPGARSVGWSELRLRAFPTRVGLYLPLLTVHGQPFRPPTVEFAMHVRAGPPAAQRSYARGPALRGGEVGQLCRFRVAVCDAYGNPLRGCAAVVRATVRHVPHGQAAAAAAAAATAAAAGRGAMAAARGATAASPDRRDRQSARAADYAAAAGAAGVLPTSPASHVSACLGAISSWRAVRHAEEAGAIASAQQRAMANAAAEDEARMRGAGRYEDDEAAWGASAHEVCIVTMDDAEEDEAPETAGWARATFVPRRAGTHVIRAYVGGLEISGSPFVTAFSAGSVAAARCVVRGEGLRTATVGTAALVEVCSYDASGNMLRRGDGGASVFVAFLQRPDGAPVDCTSRCFDRDDGSYRLAYTTFTAGAVQLSISCRGCPVRGSPFDVVVAPGRAHAPHCRIVGSGASFARLAPTVATFTLVCYDRWRNRCVAGGERVVVKAAGPTHPILSVLDLSDGSYQVCARYSLSGIYLLTVGLGARAEERVLVPGSPLTVYVGLQLAEQYLERWLGEAPRVTSSLAAEAAARAGAGGAGGGGSGGVGLLALTRLGQWRHDREALLAHTLRAWKHFVGRRLLDRMVAGSVPAGSPRVVTHKGAPVLAPSQQQQQQQQQQPPKRLSHRPHLHPHALTTTSRLSTPRSPRSVAAGSAQQISSR